MTIVTELDLHVRIPRRFHDRLASRFDSARAKPSDGPWKERLEITEPCALCDEFLVHCEGCPLESADGFCDEYLVRCNGVSCKGCPFEGFADEGDDFAMEGCLVWMEKILDLKSFVCDQHKVTWLASRDTAVRSQLAQLREKAAELIEWVEDEPPDKEAT